MRQSRQNRPSSGFSIVELMVAMVISLIGMVIIFQVFEVSEGIKRTTTGGGDAQQNGAVSLYVMERDLRNAGMGFNDTPYAGCTILAYDSQRSTPNFTLSLVPAFITAGTATVPDQLTVFYGAQQQVGDATPINLNAALGNTSLQLTSAYGYANGDLVVLNWPNQAPAVNCSLREVTGVLSNTLAHKDAGTAYLTLSGLNKLARFNKPGGLTVAYAGVGTATVSRVIDLGNIYEPLTGPNVPVYNTYAIINNALTVSSPFVLDATLAPAVNNVADNIVQMRVLYGLDDGSNIGTIDVTYSPHVVCDGIVDRFVDAATFNAIAAPAVCPANPLQTKWQSVIAVRIAIVARSALAEKPSGRDGAKCDATTDGTETTPGPDQSPRWSAGVIDVSASGDPDTTSPLYWKCYRYRVFETTVPLRNWIWRSS
jgi:type IV pilus assembly protein PilW